MSVSEKDRKCQLSLSPSSVGLARSVATWHAQCLRSSYVQLLFCHLKGPDSYWHSVDINYSLTPGTKKVIWSLILVTCA